MTSSEHPPSADGPSFGGTDGVSPRAASAAVTYLGGDPALVNALRPELARIGRPLVELVDVPSAVALLADDPPAALVLDVDTLGEPDLDAVVAACSSGTPFVFVGGATHDVRPRLAAVRAGAAAYFGRAAPVQAIAEKLDALTAPGTQQPYRVLVVDDEALLANLYVRALEHAGMIAAAATEPMKVLALLADFQPDLVLMDMQMPGVSGAELSAVIRLDPTTFSIPIVFLSTEDLRDRRVAALRRGGDDFLVKPIPLDQLVDEIAIRAERARTVSSLMLKDGLTGLYNHATFMQLFEVEVARATRNERPLAFAMIDVDHFKKVNDTHGHPAGDLVLRSLSQHLQKRLRRTDVIGRYGGEEFAVVLADADVADAESVIDGIRSSFGAEEHDADGARFRVTLSCGVATFPDVREAHRMVELADKALYTAKRGGRNRVVLAEV